MSKKHYIALANQIRAHNRACFQGESFVANQIETLAQFCADQNPRFNRQRWLDYIDGKCGPNGGKVK